MANDTIARIQERLDALEARTSQSAISPEAVELPDLSERQISSALERYLIRGDNLEKITDSVRRSLLNSTTRENVVNPLVDNLFGNAGGARSSLGQISANLLDALLRAQRYR